MVNDELVRRVSEDIKGNRGFAMIMLSNEFPQVSRIVLCGVEANSKNHCKVLAVFTGQIFLVDNGFNKPVTCY